MRAVNASSTEWDWRQQVGELIKERGEYLTTIREQQYEIKRLRLRLARYEKETVEA